MKPLVRFALYLLALVAMGCSASEQASTIQASETKQLKDAPPFRAADLTGKEWNSEELRDRTLLVEFWATWCGPCREIAPDLRAFYDRTKGKLTFLSFSLDKTEKEVADSLKEHPLPNPVIHVGPASAKAWNVKQIPALALVRNGKIVFKWEGKESVLQALKTIEKETL